MPENNWFLVPNPSIKLVHQGALKTSTQHGITHSTEEVYWDALTRQGSIQATVYGGDDKAYKASLEVHSVQGIKGKIRGKFRRGWLHSLAATTSIPPLFPPRAGWRGSGSGSGPKITWKSRFGDELKSDVILDAGRRAVVVQVKRGDGAALGGGGSSGPAMTTTLEAEIPMHALHKATRVIVGIKAHF